MPSGPSVEPAGERRAALEQVAVEAQRLGGVAGVGEQAGDAPHQLRTVVPVVGGGVVDHRPVGVDHAVAGGLGPDPEPPQVAVGPAVGQLGEGQVAERAGQAVDVAGVGLVPRQLVDDPVAERLGGEVGGQAGVGGAPVLGVGEVPVLDALAQVVGGEAEQARPGEQALLGGEEERRPDGVGERIAGPGRAEHVEQLGLGQAAAGGPQRG